MSTHIAWTDETWNPVVGCTRVSAGCDHCYAFATHDRRHVAWKRGNWPTAPEQYHQPFSKVQLLPERLEAPLHWRQPRRVFVNSMSDLFHPDVPDEYIDRVFAVMALAPQHTFQVLTKRPERMRAYLTERSTPTGTVPIRVASAPFQAFTFDKTSPWRMPLPNVWLGVSVEDQEAADKRIAELLATPAAVRFLSCEPLLGPIDLHLGKTVVTVKHLTDDEVLALKRRLAEEYQGPAAAHKLMEFDSPARWDELLHWVIVGGESGPQARPCDLAWIRSIVGQCRAASVAAFVKQLGSDPRVRDFNTRTMPGGGLLLKAGGIRDRKGGDPSEWPEDLRVREMPRA